MQLINRQFTTLLLTGVLTAGMSLNIGAEQLPATPHQAEALEPVETKTAPRPETEQRMPVGEHQKDALQTDRPKAEATGEDLSQRLDKLRTYTAAQRDEAIEEARAVLAAIDERIDQLQTRLATNGEQVTAAARERMTASLETLHTQRRELSEWMGGLMHSSAQAWQHVQTGFVDAYHAFTAQLDKAEQSF